MFWASLVAQLVKNLPAMQEIQVWSLGREDPLEKGMATHSRILAGKSYGQRSLAGYSPWGHKELDMTERLSTNHTNNNLYGKIIWKRMNVCIYITESLCHTLETNTNCKSTILWLKKKQKQKQNSSWPRDRNIGDRVREWATLCVKLYYLAFKHLILNLVKKQFFKDLFLFLLNLASSSKNTRFASQCWETSHTSWWLSFLETETCGCNGF